MRKPAFLTMVVLLSGCVDTFYPGYLGHPVTIGGSLPSGQPYQPQNMKYAPFEKAYASPGQASQSASQGFQPPQQPYAAAIQPYRPPQDLAPHDYEDTKDIEIRERVQADDVWCSQPYVAATLREIRSMRIEIEQRRVHEMAWQVENGPLHPDLITSIVGMSAGEHHCIGLSRDKCIGDGSSHVCRGLVMRERHEPVWTEFVIKGEHFDNALWRRDDVQY